MKRYKKHYISYLIQALKVVRALKAIQFFQTKTLKAHFNQRMKTQALQKMTIRPTMVATTAISKIQLDNQFKNSLNSLLQHEIPYAEILEELSRGTRQVRRMI